MEIFCEACAAKFKIADDKLPKNKILNVVCPKCKNKIYLNTITQGQPDDKSDPGTSREKKLTGPDTATPVTAPDIDEAKSFFFGEEIKTALTCDDVSKNQEMIQAVLDELGYYVHVAATPDNALDKMRYNRYDLIIINEAFGGCNSSNNPVLNYIQPMPMSTRRNLFCVLIGDNYRTMDNMAAFSQSVNLTVSSEDVPNIKKILSNAIADNDKFYKVFKETLKETGKI